MVQYLHQVLNDAAGNGRVTWWNYCLHFIELFEYRGKAMQDIDRHAKEDSYTVEVTSCSSEIESLGDCVKDLIGSDRSQLCSPRFFMASIEKKTWIPRVMIVKHANAVIGIVYAKERKWVGFPTGLTYIDATLGGMIISEPRERATVWQHALSHLLTVRSIHGLRIHVPRDGYELEATQGILRLTGADFSCADCEQHRHAILTLPRSYDIFLSRLGSITRRNFRYYRRRFEKSGHQYVEDLSISEFRGAADHLFKRSLIKASREAIERALKMFSSANRPLLVGLRARTGEWLGILGGWYDSGRATVFCQMNNDREHSKDSLSVVLRGFLIESLIAKGIEDLFFWDGASGALGRYCHCIPTATWYLDCPTRGWRTLRSFFRLVGRHLPRKIAQNLYLVSPWASCGPDVSKSWCPAMEKTFSCVQGTAATTAQVAIAETAAKPRIVA